MVGVSQRKRPGTVHLSPRFLPAGRFLSLAMFLGLAVSACARPDNWMQTYPDVAARARQQPQIVAGEAYARWNDLHGLVGSYQVRASRGVSSRTIDVQMYLLRDRFVEMQVLAPTGQSEGYLGVGRREVGFWVSDENILYRGANEPGAFERALGLDLTPAQIVAVLIGFGAPIDGGSVPPAVWDEQQQRVRVEHDNVTAWLHPVQQVVESAVVRTHSGPIEVAYEAWSVDGPPVPLRLSVHVPSEDITLRVRLASAWYANPDGLDEAYFDDIEVRDAVEAPLERLAVEGGLLRRGLGR